MSNERIPVAGPWVTEHEAAAVARAALEDWYGNAGASVGRFETAFAQHLGLRHAAAVPHCTSALHLAMLALGIGPGDEVVVPETTWVATAAPLAYVGATPVFADIDPDTWQVTAGAIERCLSPRTKAIVTVDLYGGVPDMDAVDAVATSAALPVLEDAAQSIGSTWHGRPAGALGRVATFSFHGTKTLTTGEGGMLVTDDTELFQRVQRARDHGRTATDFKFFTTDVIGFKYRMSALQAAFGLAQLERVDELVARKRQIFAWYRERLAGLDGVTLNAEPEGTFNTFWMTTAVLDRSLGIDTRTMMQRLDAAGIDSRPFFSPLSSLGAFADLTDVAAARARNTVAYDLAERAVNLPSAMRLTEADVDRVCEAVTAIVRTPERVR